MYFYDTHAHLDYPDFKTDFPEVLARARSAGIGRIVTIGTDLESSARAVALAEQHPEIYAAVGWHPSYASGAPDNLKSELRRLASHPKVVAIGETGLDYSRLPGKKEGKSEAEEAAVKAKQARIFQEQLELGEELGLNCIIHQRDSFDDVARQMEPFAGKTQGVFHCFTEDSAALRRVLDLGCLVSFTGIITFKSAQVVRDSLSQTPPDHFMLETDCPFLAPVPYRGKRCEPAYVAEMARVVAEVRKVSLEELSDQTCRTALKFFKRLQDGVPGQ